MRHALCLLLLVSGAALAAQEVRLNGGLLAGLAAPTGDFADLRDFSGEYLAANNGLGLHLGGHLDLNFSAHHQLRLHSTLHSFASEEQKRRDFLGYETTRQNAYALIQLGGDYVFNLGTSTRGAYFLAGLNFNRVSAKADYSDRPDWEATQSGRLGLRLGCGYTFNRIIGLELQLNRVGVEAGGYDGLGFDAMTWISLSAVVRFGRH